MHLIDADLLIVADLSSSRSVERTRERVGMRRRYLHMYVPGSLIPAYVVLIGRRRCCGVRCGTAHLIPAHAPTMMLADRASDLILGNTPLAPQYRLSGQRLPGGH